MQITWAQILKMARPLRVHNERAGEVIFEGIGDKGRNANVVFSAEQTRSATGGNQGTFDPARSDIRFARRARRRERLAELPGQVQSPPDLEARYNALPQGKELIDDGHFQQPDAVTGAATAIGARVEGYTAPSGYEGAPANGADFPRAVRSRNQATYRGFEEAAKRLKILNTTATDQSASQAIIELLSGQQTTDPDLRQHIDFLSQRILVVDRKAIAQAAVHLDSGGEAVVYATDDAVYKILETRNGQMRGGIVPGEIIRRSDGKIGIRGHRRPTVLDLLERIDLNNRHGGMVFTEIAGVTPDGAIVLKQPRIEGLNRSAGQSRRDLLGKLNMIAIPDIGPLAAVAQIDGQPVLFDDLSADNLMVTDQGRPFIVDVVSRVLSDAEADLVRGDVLFARRRCQID